MIFCPLGSCDLPLLWRWATAKIPNLKPPLLRDEVWVSSLLAAALEPDNLGSREPGDQHPNYVF